MLFSFLYRPLFKNRKCICLSATYNSTYKALMQV
uniref:Uncharacterized protein n=1 Tax=Siphoviridae sp. cteHV32 TaxID=2825588 RepID=A0A8S5QHL6_9CAUD|nr:MAG TPA: hypothetical protein [Siphoviridae sp. cteHV32]